MKGIVKQPEPESFTLWKAKANEDWQPTFDNLQNPEKGAVRKALLEEQGFICAYCCRRIEDKPLTTVIEHFVPQSHEDLGSAHQLDYENLFASCDGTLIIDAAENIYCCDESKKDKFSTDLIKPTEINENGFVATQAFSYTVRGGIEGVGVYKTRADYSINLLNLNNTELKRKREAAIEFLFEDAKNGEFFNFSPEEVERLKNSWSSRTDDKFEEFCPTVLYFLNHYF